MTLAARPMASLNKCITLACECADATELKPVGFHRGAREADDETTASRLHSLAGRRPVTGPHTCSAVERLPVHEYCFEEDCRHESPIALMLAIRIDTVFGGGAETCSALQWTYSLWEMRELLAVFEGAQ